MDKEFVDLNQFGLVTWLILIIDSNFEPPTAAYCKNFESQYNLNMRVLYDASGATGIYGSKETSIVSNEQGLIVNKFHSDSPATIRAALMVELSTGPGQCKTDPVCNGGQCLPTPTDDGSICTQQCDPAAPSGCPDGKTCFSYTAEHGEQLAGVSACFKPELLPQ